MYTKVARTTKIQTNELEPTRNTAGKQDYIINYDQLTNTQNALLSVII